MKDNALGRIAHIQAHIMTRTKVPVVAQVAGGVVVLSIIVALNAFIDAGALNMQVAHMRHHVAVGDIDLQLQVIVDGVGNVGIERLNAVAINGGLAIHKSM